MEEKLRTINEKCREAKSLTPKRKLLFNSEHFIVPNGDKNNFAYGTI